MRGLILVALAAGLLAMLAAPENEREACLGQGISPAHCINHYGE